jgi:hypothetical protein
MVSAIALESQSSGERMKLALTSANGYRHVRQIHEVDTYESHVMKHHGDPEPPALKLFFRLGSFNARTLPTRPSRPTWTRRYTYLRRWYPLALLPGLFRNQTKDLVSPPCSGAGIRVATLRRTGGGAGSNTSHSFYRALSAMT